VQGCHFTVRVEALQDLAVANDVIELARRGGTPHPLQFDRVIRALGWRHQQQPYTPETFPTMQYNGKFVCLFVCLFGGE
jgi:hypothetical protein